MHNIPWFPPFLWPHIPRILDSDLTQITAHPVFRSHASCPRTTPWSVYEITTLVYSTQASARCHRYNPCFVWAAWWCIRSRCRSRGGGFQYPRTGVLVTPEDGDAVIIWSACMSLLHYILITSWHCPASQWMTRGIVLTARVACTALSVSLRCLSLNVSSESILLLPSTRLRLRWPSMSKILYFLCILFRKKRSI